jgi:molybdopterin-guanine dinucleotide biosynthesis protein A
MGGSPKGLETVGQSRIIDRVATALNEVCASVILSANDDAAQRWLPSVRVVRDVHPNAGGLAGVEAALARGGDILVVAWDMPFVPAALLRDLIRRAAETGAEVVVPESDSPYGFEPFCAYYSGQVLAGLTAFLERGGGAARDFLAAMKGVHRIPLRDVRSFGDPATLFFSVNSTDDLARARTMLETER